MASDMRASLNQVLELAKLGNEGAVTKLVEAVEDIIRQLNLCAKTHPVTVRNAASRLTHWPVMYSPHPKLRLNPEDVVKMVKLGSDFPRNLDPNAKWDPRELGCKIAIHLFKYVEMVKNNPEQYNHFPYCDAARKLPNFNEDCAGQRWWEVAKSVLTFSIPNLIADPYLSQLAKGKSNRKFPSRMEQKILERVNNRFMSLFYKQNR